MISASWQTPQISSEVEKPKKKKKNKKIQQFLSIDDVLSLSDHLKNNSNIQPPETIAIDPQKELSNILDELMQKLHQSIALKQQKLTSSLSNIPYDPQGQIPFPKGGIDIDDKSVQQVLEKYGVVCPGAESVEISHDSEDPFVTVITIKKTFF